MEWMEGTLVASSYDVADNMVAGSVGGVLVEEGLSSGKPS